MTDSTFPVRGLLMLWAVSVLSGCALAPGMYAGGIDEGYEVVSKDPKTGRRISVPVYPMHLQSQAQKRQLKAPPLQPFTGYKIGPGDVISVTVWEHPELTIPQGEFRAAEAAGNLVDADGTIYYPYCGRFQVAGLTRSVLRSHLTSCLSRMIRDPQVDVRVIQFFNQRVNVGGAVTQPGVITLRNTPVHLADAIAMVGGLTEQADLRHVQITRNQVNYQVDHKRFTEKGDAAHNPLLLAGDTVHISSSAERRVNILGEVQRPQTIGLSESVRTLADALGAASGLSPLSAQPERILVMRSDGERPVVHWLNGEDPLSMLVAQSFELHPGDVVYVDQTGLIRWGRVVNQLLPLFGILNQGASAATAGN